MDVAIDSVGISPVKIFGFERDEMEAMLRGLSAKYKTSLMQTLRTIWISKH